MPETSPIIRNKLLLTGIALAFVGVVLVLPWLDKASLRQIEERRLQEGFKGYIANKFTIGSPYIVIIKAPSKETIFLKTVSDELYQAAQVNDSIQKNPGENRATISRETYSGKMVYMKVKPD